MSKPLVQFATAKFKHLYQRDEETGIHFEQQLYFII